MAGKTTAEMIDALSTAMVEISEGRIHRWQEGDKRGEFHRLDHLAKALATVKDVEEVDEDEAQTTSVLFIC